MKTLEDARGVYDYNGYSDFYEQASDSPELFRIRRYKATIYPAHFHSSVEIYYVHDGEIEVSVNTKKRLLTAGDVLVVNSLEVHSFDVREVATVTVLQFGDYYLKDFREAYGEAYLPNFLPGSAYTETILSLLQRLGQVREEIGPLGKKAYIDLLLDYIVHKYDIDYDKREGAKIMEIVRYIYQNYALYDLGLKHLAQVFNYSEVSISRFFGKYIGVNIRHYINSVRMINVRRMLADKKNKSMTITEIASRCGFDSMTTFYRCRKEFGL